MMDSRVLLLLASSALAFAPAHAADIANLAAYYQTLK